MTRRGTRILLLHALLAHDGRLHASRFSILPAISSTSLRLEHSTQSCPDSKYYTFRPLTLDLARHLCGPRPSQIVRDWLKVSSRMSSIRLGAYADVNSGRRPVTRIQPRIFIMSNGRVSGGASLGTPSCACSSGSLINRCSSRLAGLSLAARKKSPGPWDPGHPLLRAALVSQDSLRTQAPDGANAPQNHPRDDGNCANATARRRRRRRGRRKSWQASLSDWRPRDEGEAGQAGETTGMASTGASERAAGGLREDIVGGTSIQCRTVQAEVLKHVCVCKVCLGEMMSAAWVLFERSSRHISTGRYRRTSQPRRC